MKFVKLSRGSKAENGGLTSTLEAEFSLAAACDVIAAHSELYDELASGKRQ